MPRTVNQLAARDRLSQSQDFWLLFENSNYSNYAIHELWAGIYLKFIEKNDLEVGNLPQKWDKCNS